MCVALLRKQILRPNPDMNTWMDNKTIKKTNKTQTLRKPNREARVGHIHFLSPTIFKEYQLNVVSKLTRSIVHSYSYRLRRRVIWRLESWAQKSSILNNKKPGSGKNK